MITRREFVYGVACCATIAGKLVGQDSDNSKNENLVTPCGLYCGACSAYTATVENDKQGLTPNSDSKQPPMENMHCNGCLSGGQVLSRVPKCAIRQCAAAKSKTRRCSDCSEFPCSKITDFNNDGVPHHAESLSNLRQLREIGIKDWAKHEDEHWRCPKCQAMLSWYNSECPKCKAPRSDKLFPLRKA
jgi:hypothetical protein